ncbi:50S ribosomal protein L17 [bacterium]|nr:50S ribosomal protein L17 [bacterium]
MRHRKTVIKLGRTAPHRKATLANLAAALFLRKHIKTTVVKAKATRQVAERLITLAKKDTVHSRRLAFKRLNQKQVVKVLFEDIAPQYQERPGGYTRVIKLGQRQGDGAQMAVIELVGFETAVKKKKEKDKAKEAETKKKDKKKKSKESKEEETTEE